MTILDDLRAERGTLETELEAMLSNTEFDPKDETLVQARAKAESLDARIKTLVEFAQRKSAADAVDALSLQHRQEQTDKQTREDQALSLGEAWIRSAAYNDYKLLPRGTSGRVSMPFDAVEKRAPILTSSFAGLIPPDRIGPSAAPYAQTPLLDLISTVRVTSGAVEWVYYPAGAPLGTVTAEGAAKTEAAIAPELRTVTLDTIASWAQYSRQFGEDAPGLVQFLNSSLARGILDKREALAATALISDASIPVTANTGTLLEGVRRGIATIQDAGYRPQAVVLNPADYASFDVEVMVGTLRGPVVNGSYWGITVVPVGAVPSGTAYLGDFTAGMVELVRSEVQVFTTDSHASTFTSNLLTTLVEARAKAIVQRAEALTKVTGTVGGGAPLAASVKK